ncbi:cytidylate kinase-like family protein [Anaerolentibacter hominis]|uniref:cytidylate kinase-like family protein n=1 Tax=Anaerolentibacter hominis TaxID=3079009 RepID=UPI0031B896A7
MEKVVITIARQYGSGGKTVGRMLAQDLGIPCYEREILKMASEDSGINEKLFAQVDEKLKAGFFSKLVGNVYSGDLISPESENFVSNDNLFNYQAKVLKELAERESFVVIGRCADFILKDRPNVISVFVHAPKDFCLEMAAERHGRTPHEMEKFVQKVDKYRADYYKYYTGHDWLNAKNYDLCLDSSKLGFDKCVDAIKGYMEVRMK